MNHPTLSQKTPESLVPAGINVNFLKKRIYERRHQALGDKHSEIAGESYLSETALITSYCHQYY